jgi:lipopolysaccharide transport system permease protein
MSPVPALLQLRLYRDAYSRAWALARRHRQLLWELQKRDLSDRYVGSMLGVLWGVVHPLFLMGVYVVVFGFVFKLRFGDASGMRYDYPAYIIAGYLPWMAMMDVMARSASVVHANVNLIKQVAFPTELLPAKTLLGSLLPQLVGTAFLLAYLATRFGEVPGTVLLLPLALAMQYVAAMGLAWLLALIGAYFRDAQNVLQVFFLANLYFMPVVFAPQWTPALLAKAMLFNPFAHLVWVYQDILFYGAIAHPWSWVTVAALSLAAFTTGFNLFNHAKQAFGNVL